MTTIRILPEILSNQIAAGEVVQRPASVVKELVENSIDAGASLITIDIERGGKSLIRVSDDGKGLVRDDALLCIERYATSKIYTKEDLFSISTMGFRGEALPSIASVSRFCLTTRTKDSDVGTRIEIAGGKLVNVTDHGAPVGTMVEVKHLFFNTPARKKFLKSDNTEISHIVDAVSGMALGNPHVQFRLFLNRKLFKNFSHGQDLFQRSVNVLGNDVAKRLVPVKSLQEDDASGGVGIQGFVALPDVSRSSGSKIFLFVNRRLIHDRGLVAAIFQGYRGRLMKGRYPLVVVFVEIGFDQVDVNVHPCKREVKFFNPRQVYQALAGAVGNALEAGREHPTDDSKTKPQKFGFLPQFQDHTGREFAGNPDRVEQSVFEWQAPAKTESGPMPYPEIYPNVGLEPKPNIYAKPDGLKPAETRTPDSGPKIQTELLSNRTISSSAPPGPSNIGPIPTRQADPPRIIGQVMGTYILAESNQGLILIDQHAAHERIVYEALNRRHQSLDVVSQDLVVPETLELGHRESDCLNRILQDLEALGFHIEHFGGATYVIKAVPALIAEQEIKPVVVEIVEKTMIDKTGFSRGKWREDCLVLMACHTAIRANKSMNAREMQALLDDLANCENPFHCPHGRPITLAFSKEELEKMFKRVV